MEKIMTVASLRRVQHSRRIIPQRKEPPVFSSERDMVDVLVGY